MIRGFFRRVFGAEGGEEWFFDMRPSEQEAERLSPPELEVALAYDHAEMVCAERIKRIGHTSAWVNAWIFGGAFLWLLAAQTGITWWALPLAVGLSAFAGVMLVIVHGLICVVVSSLLTTEASEPTYRASVRYRDAWLSQFEWMKG